MTKRKHVATLVHSMAREDMLRSVYRVNPPYKGNALIAVQSTRIEWTSIYPAILNGDGTYGVREFVSFDTNLDKFSSASECDQLVANLGYGVKGA